VKISPERWAQLEPHFDAVIDLDEPEREAYVVRLAGEDASLAEDLRRLMRARFAGGRFEDLPSEAPDLLSAAAADRGDPDLANRQVGPYRIVRTIGRGGMSVVYLAERTDGKFEQQVAVKVMHWTGGSRAIERFRMEQQTLARLDHPSITRIFDSGVTDDGLPYFVMEWIDGQPITRAVTDLAPGVRDRARLFVRICEAVHSAHQRLVVHRDLKPDNVLMTRDGNVKVLDFGIAKWLTEDEDDAQAAFTRHGEGLLTPQYAAPEQYLDQPVTTATDIYALGLLLYELLVGRPPYELAGKPITEQRRLVCEQDAAPLSTRAENPRLARELSGDLQTICAKALQKEPGRRYDSAAALAGDLRRYLDGQPVLAAPDSAGYRASRFVRRHKAPVAIAALATLGLIAAAGITAWQARIASSERDKARVEAAHSQKIVDFLVGSLEQSNPYADDGGAVTVRDYLERSSERIDTELADQPEVRALVYTTIARVFAHTGERRRGQSFADRAIELSDSLYGRRSVEAAAARYEMARILVHSDIDSAMHLRLETIADLEGRKDDRARLLLADLLEGYSLDLSQRTLFDSALTVQKRSLAIRTELRESPHTDLARAHHYMAALRSGMNDPGAGADFARAAEEWKATLGPNHPNYGATINNWAIWLEGRGQPDSAEALYAEALEIDRKTLAPTSPDLASRYNNIGRLALNRGRLGEAEAYLNEAAAILRQSEASDLQLAAAITNLGLAAFLREDYAEAEARYREGRAMFVRRFGEDHVYTAVADSYIGRTLWQTGRLAEAERLLARAAGVFEAHQPSLAPRLAATRTWYGRLLAERDPARAEEQLRAALDVAAEHLVENSPARGEAETALGQCLVKRGANEEGMMRLESGYTRLLAAHGERHPMTQWALSSLRSPQTL
jgi:serine/threonine-protein kinase